MVASEDTDISTGATGYFSSMPALILVGLGGGIGAISRYLLGAALHSLAGYPRFPVGTLGVNLLGCLLIGVLAAAGEERTWFTPDIRLLLITGLLGGFTTFSAFGLETLTLLRSHSWLAATLNLLISVPGGLAAVWLGWRLAGSR